MNTIPISDSNRPRPGCDCLIVGGGVIGMLSARELATAGMQVTLVERGGTGRASSWAGGGILSPLYPWRYDPAVTALARWGQDRYRALAESLAAGTGIDPEWTPSGLLILDTEEAEQARAWAGEAGVALEEVGADESRRLEPALAPPGRPGLWMPGVAQVRNPRLVKALRQDLRQRGVTLHEGEEVLDLETTDGCLQGVITRRGKIRAGCVLVAAGAWSGDLLARQGVELAVAPVKGQMILFRTPPGSIQRITLSRDRYIIPRRDGRVLFGSTLEQAGFDRRATTEVRASLRNIAVARFPVLENAPVEHHWAGLRPGSPAGIPFIGPVPGIDGLWLNTGHYRNGVVLAPASARLAADLILGRDPILPPAAYRLAAPRHE